jgi:hypothetical protein
MFSLELVRAIQADRLLQVERAMVRRRLLEAIAIRPTSHSEEGSTSGGRDPRPGTAGSPVLGPSR